MHDACMKGDHMRVDIHQMKSDKKIKEKKRKEEARRERSRRGEEIQRKAYKGQYIKDNKKVVN